MVPLILRAEIGKILDGNIRKTKLGQDRHDVSKSDKRPGQAKNFLIKKPWKKNNNVDVPENNTDIQESGIPDALLFDLTHLGVLYALPLRLYAHG
jgi:hypothetical protein